MILSSRPRGGLFTILRLVLPADEPGDGYFYITDGMYGVDVEKDGDTNETEKVDMFRISILGADKIAVVALKDNSRYVMTRDS